MAYKLFYWRGANDIILYANKKQQQHCRADVLKVVNGMQPVLVLNIALIKGVPEVVGKERTSKNEDASNGWNAPLMHLSLVTGLIDQPLKVGHLYECWRR